VELRWSYGGNQGFLAIHDFGRGYKPYAIYDGAKWLLWYNGRHGGLEQIGLALHPGEDLGF